MQKISRAQKRKIRNTLYYEKQFLLISLHLYSAKLRFKIDKFLIKIDKFIKNIKSEMVK